MGHITVIVPVYNAGDFLDECITSIKKELRDEDELILINDGSNDDSLAICERHRADNVLVINNANQGVSHTRNHGIRLATKEYITFVDADDYLRPGWREFMAVGVRSGADMVFFSQTPSRIPNKKGIVYSVLGLSEKQNSSLFAGACWYKLFRLDFIRQSHVAFDPEVINGEDGLFCLNAVLCCDSYEIVPASNFYFYRTNTASATHRFDERFYLSNEKYIKMVDKWLTESGIFSPSEIVSAVQQIRAHGLYVLACRISLSDNYEQYFQLFERQENVDFFRQYTPDRQCSLRTRTVFKLLKNGKYKAAMRNIITYRKIYALIRKVMR